jgi:hypothetical protein
MDKLIFDFVNPGFSAESSAHCSLNLIAGTEGFSLLVFGKNGAIQALKSWHFPHAGRDFKDVETRIRTVFGSEKIFSFPFKDVRCAFFNLNATLVPRRLFNAEDLPAYFKLLLRPAEYEYRYDELPECDCFLVYAAEPVVLNLCAQYFPQGRLSHLAASLLKNWRLMASVHDYEVFLNVRNQAAQIAVFDRRNLLFYNAFQFEKANDLLYFTLLAYDQFRLDPAEIPLTVSGSLLEDSDLLRTLFRYVRTIRFASLLGNVSLPEGAESLPGHFWFDLFSISNHQ